MTSLSESKMIQIMFPIILSLGIVCALGRIKKEILKTVYNNQ